MCNDSGAMFCTLRNAELEPSDLYLPIDLTIAYKIFLAQREAWQKEAFTAKSSS